MADNITFVHLTDLHVGDPSAKDDHLFSDTTATFRAIAADIRRMKPSPAFIVASGDLTNRGDAASYEHLKSLISEADLNIPMLFALGNHDTREGFYPVMLGRTEDTSAPHDHDLVVAGIHIIVMDSSVPKKIGGAFEPGQLDWLAMRLSEHAGLPKLLVMHHAPALDEEDFDGEWETLAIADTIALRDLLIDRSDIVGILSGHIHFDRVSSWYGIPLVVGVGQHAATDVVGLGDSFRMLEGASMAIGTIRPSGLTISFAPQPSTRRELHVLDMERIREIVARSAKEATSAAE
ncbi:metallophosphoesterase [Rhizobium mayense]|uniref:Metallophosphoesterase n=1 Tax=Rhizobium mayense TaxID=1312184 RepID=A0ABT7JZU7_9HYPH|nr:metallophosphoesterase [Rhizobium mayense]MDL2401874.1 metallophosphoesterase [Rhizobium mayense]